MAKLEESEVYLGIIVELRNASSTSIHLWESWRGTEQHFWWGQNYPLAKSLPLNQIELYMVLDLYVYHLGKVEDELS